MSLGLGKGETGGEGGGQTQTPNWFEVWGRRGGGKREGVTASQTQPPSSFVSFFLFNSALLFSLFLFFFFSSFFIFHFSFFIFFAFF